MRIGLEVLAVVLMAAVISMTPAVTTVLYAHLGGTAEIAASGLDTQMNVLVSQATAANVVVVKRGSICRWSAMP